MYLQSFPCFNVSQVGIFDFVNFCNLAMLSFLGQDSLEKLFFKSQRMITSCLKTCYIKK